MEDDYDDWEDEYYDYEDDDPRIRCFECEAMYFPESGILACEDCEEFVCKECKEIHRCDKELDGLK